METIDTRFVAECSTYDFKRELDRKKKNTWLKSVSAFANTTGGSLYFGVDNDGQVLGLADAQSDAEFISETMSIPTVVRWLISVPAMKAFLPLLISCSIWC